MKKQINDIRELIWPLLEPMPIQNAKIFEKPEINIDSENLDFAYDLQKKNLENEEDRRKGIESKAALLLNTISIASSLLIAATSLITGKCQMSVIIKISVLISFILSIYAIRTVWFSIKALERKAFKIIDFKDINIKGTKTEYQKSIIIRMLEYNQYNQKVTNEKIDFLAMAQEYYKRAIVLISLYSFIIFMWSVFFK